MSYASDFVAERLAKNIAKGKTKLLEEALGDLSDAGSSMGFMLDVIGKEDTCRTYQRQTLEKYQQRLRDFIEEFEAAFQEAEAEDFAESLEHPNLSGARGSTIIKHAGGNLVSVQVFRKSDETDRCFPVVARSREDIYAWLSEA